MQKKSNPLSWKEKMERKNKLKSVRDKIKGLREEKKQDVSLYIDNMSYTKTLIIIDDCAQKVIRIKIKAKRAE